MSVVVVGVDEKQSIQIPIPIEAKTADAPPAEAPVSPDGGEKKDEDKDNNKDKDKNEEKDKDEEAKPDSDTAAIKQVSFTELFRYASSYDKALMTLGSIGAMGTGASQPIMTM